ncbi:MAG: ATP-binding cassette domain-containing protein [Acidobacteria bacterium]|nr:ATP-binding cassette domain-containing protein [Acidobacteriota bacterium]
MAASAPFLRIEHLCRTANGRSIIKDVSLEVHHGEVVAIVGPSGSGKSSLLRLLNRLDEPTAGTCFIEERDYREISPRMLRRRLGMVLQTPFLFAGTVGDNIRFGPSQRGESLTEEAVNQLLDQVSLPGFSERAVQNLSGGEAQRVAIARCLANEPEVLLLDEPTSALDDAVKRDVESLVQRIVIARRLTCLIVTHDLAQARRVAKRVVLLEQGRISRIGSPEEVFGGR